MDTNKLIESLRSLQPSELEWKFALYNARKGRDGVELEWYSSKMQGISSWVDTIKTSLLEKTTADKTVADYSPFLSDKEHIAAIEKTNDLIKDQITNILINIKNALNYSPEDFVSGTLPKITGFAFYGELKDDNGEVNGDVLFMRRSNPFLSGNKVRLCTSSGSEIVTVEKPILKFTPATDFIFIGDICYFNSSAIEKDFELENRHFAIAAKRMNDISEAGIVSDFEKLEAAAMSPRNARKFMDFDIKILEHIARLGVVEREEFLSTFGIILDNDGRMDSFDAEQCELIIDLLCCRSFLDALGRLSTGSNVMPRE